MATKFQDFFYVLASKQACIFLVSFTSRSVTNKVEEDNPDQIKRQFSWFI